MVAPERLESFQKAIICRLAVCLVLHNVYREINNMNPLPMISCPTVSGRLEITTDCLLIAQTQIYFFDD